MPRSVAEVAEHNDTHYLTSYSTPVAFVCGTGLAIYKDLLLPAILDAKHEVVLATCFWALSTSLSELVSTLRQLSTKTISTNRKIKVYICLSSRSVTQKLFHTSSPDGYIYPPGQYIQKLGMPPPSELPGLNITVKSLFFRPFSVLHSKYVIVDRQQVYLPSCNVSWEDWYECAIGFEGPVVKHVFDFWKSVWRPSNLSDLHFTKDVHRYPRQNDTHSQSMTTFPRTRLRTTLTPHPHDPSLRQALWFLPSSISALPATPLNETLLNLITNAKHEVVLLTPNFTSPAAFAAVCFAVKQGVNVHLITNRLMMVPEQLVTAGVLTEQYVDRLTKAYRQGFSSRKMQRKLRRLAQLPAVRSVVRDKRKDDRRLESGASSNSRIGTLKVSYFRQPPPASIGQYSSMGIASRADKSHIKLTLIDRKSIVLGSGNMDRASWRTSQELGVLIQDQDSQGKSTGAVEKIWEQVEGGLEGCLEEYFNCNENM